MCLLVRIRYHLRKLTRQLLALLLQTGIEHLVTLEVFHPQQFHSYALESPRQRLRGSLDAPSSFPLFEKVVVETLQILMLLVEMKRPPAEEVEVQFLELGAVTQTAERAEVLLVPVNADTERLDRGRLYSGRSTPPIMTVDLVSIEPQMMDGVEQAMRFEVDQLTC